MGQGNSLPFLFHQETKSLMFHRRSWCAEPRDGPNFLQEEGPTSPPSTLVSSGQPHHCSPPASTSLHPLLPLSSLSAQTRTLNVMLVTQLDQNEETTDVYIEHKALKDFSSSLDRDLVRDEAPQRTGCDRREQQSSCQEQLSL